MTIPAEALLNYLETRGLTLDPRYMQDALRTLAQALMESEVSQMLEAAPYERNDARRAYRNGYRDTTWATPLGALPVGIPKLRKGTYYPHFLNDDAAVTLLQLVQAAYVSGVELPELQAALDTLPLALLRPSDLADIAQRLDDAVYNAQHGPLSARYPWLVLDVVPVHRPDRVGWRQIALVLGIQPSGAVDLLAHELVSGLDDAVWRRLLRRVRARGQAEPTVVIGEDYAGVRTAVEEVLVDAVWQHHRRFRQQVPDAALVDAVSNLYLPVDSSSGHLPRMQWIVPHSQFDYFADWPLLVVA
jgi:putative transposase